MVGTAPASVLLGFAATDLHFIPNPGTYYKTVTALKSSACSLEKALSLLLPVPNTSLCGT